MGILAVIPICLSLSLGADHQIGDETYTFYMLASIYRLRARRLHLGRPRFAISDTTILSSMAAGCDHIAHVRKSPAKGLCDLFRTPSLGEALALGDVEGRLDVPIDSGRVGSGREEDLHLLQVPVVVRNQHQGRHFVFRQGGGVSAGIDEEPE